MPVAQRSPRLSIRTRFAGAFDRVQEVVHPLVDVQVDRRSVHTDPGSLRLHLYPFRIRSSVHRVLLQRGDQPRLAEACPWS